MLLNVFNTWIWKHSSKLTRNFGGTAYHYQKQNIIKSEEEPKANIYKESHFDKIKTVYKHTKKPAREPLVKNFFCGKVDNELLTYPEAVPRDDVTNLYKDVEYTLQHLQNILDSEQLNKKTSISKDAIEKLKQIKSFGKDVPHEYGGRGYNATESCFNSETEAEDINIATVLNAHRLVTQIIMDQGTEDQKKKYLQRLANGELIGTVAFYESEVAPEGFFNTKAFETNHGDTWIINGEKSFISNAVDANLYILLAQTTTPNELGDRKDSVTAFLVEGSLPGIYVKPADTTIGCKGVKQCSIKFDSVEIQPENVIGTIGNGTAIGQKVFKHARIQSGILSVILLKKIIQSLSKFCLETAPFGIKLMEMELIRDKLAKAVTATYALESMIYLTAGLMDTYENQDVDMETAIIRVYSQQILYKVASIALDFIGPKALVSGEASDEYLRNALQLYTHGEPLDSLNVYIALSGLQHLGMSIHTDVKKIRNPLFFPGYILKKMFENKNIDNPKLTLNLNHYLHPTLDPAAQWLEMSVIRLQAGSEMVLARHGVEVTDKQVDLTKLSEMAILLYATFASMARSSRAYCIGLQHSDYEVLFASVFCHDSMKSIKRIVVDIGESQFNTIDINNQKIAKQLFQSKGYFATHPLTRNF